MSHENNHDTSQQQGNGSRKRSSLIGRIIGTLFFSLFLSIIIEWIGMAFIWEEPGAGHSQAVMEQEFTWFSAEFRQGLLYSKPVELISEGIQTVHYWLFVQTGIQAWLDGPGSSTISQLLYQYFGAYIEAMLYVIVIFMIRLAIIVLTCPLFVLTGLVGLIDGLVQRDLRKFGIGRESAYKYHYAKRYISPIMLLAWMLYLSVPFSIHPNFILIPAAILFGWTIRVTASSFKKYL